MKRKRPGYWNSFDTLRIELEPYIRQYGYLPSRGMLEKLGRKDLVKAIYKHEGFKKVAEKLNVNRTPVSIPTKRDSFDCIKNELLEVIQEYNLKEFPTDPFLRSMGKSSLYAAISKYKHDRQKLASALNIPIAKRSPGYWTMDRTLSELTPICKPLGRMPTNTELCEMGRFDLSSAITKSGSYPYVAKLIGYETGYLTALDGHIVDSIRELVFDNILSSYSLEHEVHPKISARSRYKADFLVRGVFFEILLCHLYETKTTYRRTYIRRYSQKKKLYDSLGHTVVELAPDYFDSSAETVLSKTTTLLKSVFGDNELDKSGTPSPGRIYSGRFFTPEEYFTEFLLPICKELQRMPTAEELRAMKQHSLVKAIMKHGGIHEVGQMLGFKSKRGHKPRYYADIGKVISELRTISAGTGKMPTREYLYKYGHARLVSAIEKYHGGWHKIARALGLEVSHKNKGFWTKERIMRELKKLKESGVSPITQQELRKGKLHGVLNYARAHGGLVALVKELGGEVTREYLRIDEIEEIIRSIGNKKLQVTYEQLREAGYSKIISKLQKDRHLENKLKERGITIHRKRQFYWNEERVMKVMKDIYLKHGKVTHDLLKREAYGGASAYIQKKMGGIKKLKALLYQN